MNTRYMYRGTTVYDTAAEFSTAYFATTSGEARRVRDGLNKGTIKPFGDPVFCTVQVGALSHKMNCGNAIYAEDAAGYETKICEMCAAAMAGERCHLPLGNYAMSGSFVDGTNTAQERARRHLRPAPRACRDCGVELGADEGVCTGKCQACRDIDFIATYGCVPYDKACVACGNLLSAVEFPSDRCNACLDAAAASPAYEFAVWCEHGTPAGAYCDSCDRYIGSRKLSRSSVWESCEFSRERGYMATAQTVLDNGPDLWFTEGRTFFVSPLLALPDTCDSSAHAAVQCSDCGVWLPYDRIEFALDWQSAEQAVMHRHECYGAAHIHFEMPEPGAPRCACGALLAWYEQDAGVCDICRTGEAVPAIQTAPGREAVLYAERVILAGAYVNPTIALQRS